MTDAASSIDSTSPVASLSTRDSIAPLEAVLPIDLVSPVDWERYAQCYDLLCEINPAYWELEREFEKFMLGSGLPRECSILDLGGGTGNFFVSALPVEYHHARLVHLDSNPKMTQIAAAKYKLHHLDVQIITADATTTELDQQSLDCVLCVNALYAMSHPTHVIEKMLHWLKPGGLLYLVNLGRVQRTLEWTLYITLSNLLPIGRRIGLRRMISFLRNEGRIIQEANRSITSAQQHGRYWHHTTTELGQYLRAAGFRVEQLRACYRGYSDLAICRRPD